MAETCLCRGQRGAALGPFAKAFGRGEILRSIADVGAILRGRRPSSAGSCREFTGGGLMDYERSEQSLRIRPAGR